jgi:predicted acetyltransferase
MNEVIYKKFSELSNEEKNIALSWWSHGTQVEKHMLNETPKSLKDSLLEGFIAYQNNKLVGAAGIFLARTKSGEKIYHNKKLVVELGSNYIKPSSRNNGVGNKLLISRIAFSKSKNWQAVSVTTNSQMQHIFKKIKATPMDNIAELEDLREKLCICKEVCSSCMSCPLQKEAAWLL